MLLRVCRPWWRWGGGYESLCKKYPLLLFGLFVAGMDGMALSLCDTVDSGHYCPIQTLTFFDAQEEVVWLRFSADHACLSSVCVSTVSRTQEGDLLSTLVKITKLLAGESLKTTTLPHLDFSSTLRNVRCLFIMK